MFFEQVAIPGREAAIDFTHATDLGVTIAGEALPHLCTRARQRMAIFVPGVPLA